MQAGVLEPPVFKPFSSFPRNQNRFRQKLYFLRQYQLEKREEEHHQLAVEWRERQQTIKEWKVICNAGLCPLCGLKESEDCCLIAVKSVVFWQRIIRRLSGFYPIELDSYSGSEWKDWAKGKPGWRSCGPASWDNAIRALEEG